MAATVSARARTSPWPLVEMHEALHLVRTHADAARTEVVEVDPADAVATHGAVVAEDVVAHEPMPSFRASVMDGYAVVAGLAADGPGVYPVADAVTAGTVPEVPLARGQVVRVTTGAAVPPGADAVVMVEATRLARADPDGREAAVEVTQAVRAGDNIRAIGCDLAPGERVLAAGDTVRAPELGLLAALGTSRLRVHRRPVVAVLSTGDELVDAVAARATALHGAQIRDSNRPTLLQAVRDAGCTAHDAGIASDASTPLRAVLEAALRVADVVVTSGGVSMGETDLVKPTLQALGAKVHFGRVQMKPGKPMTFATVPPPAPGQRPRLVFCLPGNPVSSAVCFALFVRPALRRLAGARHPDPPVVPVECLEPWSLDGRPEYVRVHVRLRHPGALTAPSSSSSSVAAGAMEDAARPLLEASRTGGQLSSRLMSMHSANALLVLPGRTDARPLVAAGDVVPAVLIGALDGND